MKKYMVLITWLVIGVGCRRLVEEKPIEVLITTDTTVYSLQDTVYFTFRVINTSNKTVHLWAPDRPPYNVLIFSNDNEIWHWKKGVWPDPWNYDIAPQETLTLSPIDSLWIFWLQVENNDSLVPRGYYKAIGVLETDPEYRSEPIIIKLK
jgi:hypothetical protein